MPTEAKENFGRLIFQGVENLAEKKSPRFRGVLCSLMM